MDTETREEFQQEIEKQSTDIVPSVQQHTPKPSIVEWHKVKFVSKRKLDLPLRI